MANEISELQARLETVKDADSEKREASMWAGKLAADIIRDEVDGVEVRRSDVDDAGEPVVSLRLTAVEDALNEHLDTAHMIAPQSFSVAIRGNPAEVKNIIERVHSETDDVGAPYDEVIEEAESYGYGREETEEIIDGLRTRGEIYVPQQDYLRTT